MDLAVIPECYIDTNLLETLVPPKSRYNHQHGCGTVANRMIRNFSDSFALGIIDKDKKDINYLKEFDIVVQETGLILHKHKIRHHYIIQISPAMEMFILNNAKSVDVILEDFGLPSDLGALKDLTKKQIRSKDDQKFRALFKAILNAGSREFYLFSEWVKYLKVKKYHVELDELKSF